MTSGRRDAGCEVGAGTPGPRAHPTPGHRTRGRRESPSHDESGRDVPLGQQLAAGGAPKTRSDAWTWLLFAALGFLGGQVLAAVFVTAAAAAAAVALAHRHRQAERAADLVRPVHTARAVGRVLRFGLAGHRVRGTNSLAARPRPPVPVDGPHRDPHRRGRPVPGGPDLHPHRPARPRLQPAIRRTRPATDRRLPRHRLRRSSPSSRWSVHRSSRSSSSAECCSGPWPGCSAPWGAGWARHWPSSSPACCSGWPTPSRSSSSAWPCSASSSRSSRTAPGGWA